MDGGAVYRYINIGEVHAEALGLGIVSILEGPAGQGSCELRLGSKGVGDGQGVGLYSSRLKEVGDLEVICISADLLVRI